MRHPAQAFTYTLLIGLVTACSKPVDDKVLYFSGACDASAAVALDDDLFVIANDEDNVLRVYSRSKPGPPVSQVNLTSFLRPQKRAEESDLEAAAQIGDRIYWITSHGRSARGEERETRHRFFATSGTVRNGAVELRAIGSFYSRLLEDMLGDPRLAEFNLQRAAGLPPKASGGLNIEGLAATPDGHLLIGFRNPVPKGRALLVPLLNPDDLLAGKPARFGDPVTLDLGGLGVRSLACSQGFYWIVAGPPGSEGNSRLYRWVQGRSPEHLPAPEIRGLNPEAVALFGTGGGHDLLVISDDGTFPVGAVTCKKVKDPKLRRFRAVAISP